MKFNKMTSSLLVLLLSVSQFITECSQQRNETGDDTDDLCSNAIGNGNEIISGPTGPAGGDYDQVFRSLEVDPSNADAK